MTAIQPHTSVLMYTPRLFSVIIYQASEIKKTSPRTQFITSICSVFYFKSTQCKADPESLTCSTVLAVYRFFPSFLDWLDIFFFFFYLGILIKKSSGLLYLCVWEIHVVICWEIQVWMNGNFMRAEKNWACFNKAAFFPLQVWLWCSETERKGFNSF